MAKATQQVFAEDMSEEKVDFCLEIATDAFNQASFQGKVYSYVANFIRAALEKQYGKGWNVVVGKCLEHLAPALAQCLLAPDFLQNQI